jgi:hypothetical protein
MEQTHSRSTSVTCAAVLLDAWECRDVANLRRYLDSALQTEAPGDLSELECERRELVSGIAENMREALAKNLGVMTACDVETSLDLLRHLASSAR